MDVYFVKITDFPAKVFEANPDVKHIGYTYFVVASNQEDAEELALYLFKEEFGLYTGCYEISLYLREVVCETYKCPTEFTGFDTKKYRATLAKTSRVSGDIYSHKERM